MSEHQDKTFVVTFVAVIATLVAVTIFLIILAVSLQDDEDPEQLALARERAEERLQPMAKVYMSGEPLPAVAGAAKGPAEPLTTEQVVQNVCSGCHGTGVMGAPRIGEQGDWSPRMEQGLETLVQNAITGIRGMPPRGGDATLSDEQVRAAVVHILNQSGIQAE